MAETKPETKEMQAAHVGGHHFPPPPPPLDYEPAPTLEDPVLEPRAVTVAESAVELSEFIDRTAKRMAKGSKSDIDKIVPVLQVILVWVNALIANSVPPPPEVRSPLDIY